ncbi:MAG: hypothetical protein J6V83_03400 [Clostridia bacterium]|nr:hypothetical protein [Clostridia bacterium]MBO7156432.1 hypothetical protein [Clostridia bacterium]
MLIVNDVLDIHMRLKEIDPDYTLHYNVKKGRYELHGRYDQTLLVFPYKTIDVRMVAKARETRIERINEIISEMDAYNEKLEQSRKRDAENYYQDLLKEKAEMHYAGRR